MKYPCELVRDLLPLYQDEVCSPESRVIVEEHLKECQPCRKVQKQLQDTTIEDRLQREGEQVIDRYKKQVKKKTFLVGSVIAAILAIPVLICLIVNLASGHALDWFFIVLTSLMVFASLTIVPLMANQKKGLWTIGAFTASLLLLLLTCCLYTGGNWFFVASVPVLFGLSVCFLPYVLHCLPLKGGLARQKGLLSMAADTLLLYGVIVVSGIYANPAGYWEPALQITTVCVLFVWLLFALIRYARINGWLKAGLCTILTGTFLAFLEDIVWAILYGNGHISILQANLMEWNSTPVINANVYLLVWIGSALIGVGLMLYGILPGRKHRR